MKQSRPLLLIAAIVFTVLAWASAFIVIRGVVDEFGGGELALGRLLVGTVALGVIVLAARTWVWPSKREWWQLALYGVGWFGAYNVALNIAEHTLDAGTTAMIVNIGPILIAVGAGIVLGEGIPRWLAIGAGIAFFGVILIGVGTSLTSGTHLNVAGILWCLVAALTYTIGVLAQKPVMRRIPVGQATFIGCVIGTIACLPFLPSLVQQASTATPGALWSVVYLGVVPTALAFTTWSYALVRVPAGQLGISTYVVPPLTIIAGYFVFAEIPAPLAIVGGVLCLVGVAVSRRTSRVRQPAETLAE